MMDKCVFFSAYGTWGFGSVTGLSMAVQGTCAIAEERQGILLVILCWDGVIRVCFLLLGIGNMPAGLGTRYYYYMC